MVMFLCDNIMNPLAGMCIASPVCMLILVYVHENKENVNPHVKTLRLDKKLKKIKLQGTFKLNIT